MSGRHIRVLDIFSLYQEKKTSPNIFFLTYSISDKYKKKNSISFIEVQTTQYCINQLNHLINIMHRCIKSGTYLNTHRL